MEGDSVVTLEHYVDNQVHFGRYMLHYSVMIYVLVSVLIDIAPKPELIKQICFYLFKIYALKCIVIYICA